MDKIKLFILLFFVAITLSLLFTYRWAEKTQQGSGYSKLALILAESDLTIGVYLSETRGVQREISLHRQIRTIRKYFPSTPILVANDGQPLDNMKLHKNVDYLLLPFGSGSVFAKNALVNATQTKYFLSIGNDFLLEDASVLYLIDFLLEHPEVDIVGGAVANEENIAAELTQLPNGTLSFCRNYSKVFLNDNCFATHQLFNFFVTKREYLQWQAKEWKRIPTDDFLFFFQTKQMGGKVVSCPHVKVTRFSRPSFVSPTPLPLEGPSTPKEGDPSPEAVEMCP